jgi:hypothetical protein
METLIPRVQANPDDVGAAIESSFTQQFRSRFPDQIEQCMRLVAERLQGQLKAKRADIPTAQEIESLSRSLDILWTLRENVGR